MILGLAPVHCMELFEHVMDQVRRGTTLPVGRDAPNMAGDVPFRLLPVPSEHWTGDDCLLLGFASYYGPRQIRFSGEPFLQLIHPDRNLRFLWDDGAMDVFVRDQPVLADGDPPTRRTPVRRPVDNSSICPICSGEPRNRAERRAAARRRR